MVTLEQVEKLRQHAGVSYEDAKKALEETNGDMLEAIIYLEKHNLINKPQAVGYYHSQSNEQQANNDSANANSNNANNSSGNSFGESVKRFVKWCGKIIHKGNVNNFKVTKDNEKIMELPLTVMAILLIVAFWIVIPVVVIGLFFGYRYWFEGPDAGNPKVNKAMESVANAADNIKKDLTNEMNDSNTGNQDEQKNGQS
jgi:hypothetical protein